MAIKCQERVEVKVVFKTTFPVTGGINLLFAKLFLIFSLMSVCSFSQCKIYDIQDRFPSDNLCLQEKQNIHVSLYCASNNKIISAAGRWRLEQHQLQSVKRIMSRR